MASQQESLSPQNFLSPDTIPAKEDTWGVPEAPQHTWQVPGDLASDQHLGWNYFFLKQRMDMWPQAISLMTWVLPVRLSPAKIPSVGHGEYTAVSDMQKNWSWSSKCSSP